MSRSRTLTNDARALKSQHDPVGTYCQFLHQFLFSYDRILNYVAEIDVHVENNILNISVILISSLITLQSVIFVSIYMLQWKESQFSRKLIQCKILTIKMSGIYF